MVPGSKRKIVPAVFFLCILSIILLNSQYPHNNDSDKKYIEAFLKAWKIEMTPQQVHQSFENEIAFISRIQDSVISQIKHTAVPHQAFGKISYYFNNRKGQCYDRAVLMEKIFSYYQFPFRHIYVFFGKNEKLPNSFDFFKKGLSSHALFELKTSRGWMAVGTNANWIGLSQEETVVSIAGIRKRATASTLNLTKKGTIGFVPFWKQEGANFRYVYGIYSRHGDFFNHNIQAVSLSMSPSNFHMLPDYNLKMLLYNFFK